MKILAIEASSLVASVAIISDDVIIAEYTMNYKKTHSQTLLPMIDEICRMTEFDMNTLDAIAISGGPGSFTGLRIGSATAKGFAEALELPIINVPTLEAMAYNMYGTDAYVCPIMDAKRMQTYTGIYSFEKGQLNTVMPQAAIAIEELISKLNELGHRTIFVGDGIPVFADTIAREATFEYEFAPANMNRQRAASVAALAATYIAVGRVEKAGEHLPEYLRMSQAERERMERSSAE